jgi:tetratricopeptide (TPR) repeat protein
MKLKLPMLLLIAAAGLAAAQPSEFVKARGYYTSGEFKKAAAHFQLALETNPNDAESWYWMGMSHQHLADITAPFDHKHRGKARLYLTTAVELAPGRIDYRRELFDFLLDSAGSSRTTLRQAADMLRTIPDSDPDYIPMCRRLEEARGVNSSLDARLGRLFLAAPRAAYHSAELTMAVLPGGREALPPVPGR